MELPVATTLAVYWPALHAQFIDLDDSAYVTRNFQLLGGFTWANVAAAFRPETNCLLHYKGERYFLINIFANRKPGVDLFAVGNKGRGSLEGTWKDAEDGLLSGNPIAQGSVDSVVCIPLWVLTQCNEFPRYREHALCRTRQIIFDAAFLSLFITATPIPVSGIPGQTRTSQFMQSRERKAS